MQQYFAEEDSKAIPDAFALLPDIPNYSPIQRIHHVVLYLPQSAPSVQLAQNVQQLVQSALIVQLVHSTNQLAISRSHHAIVALRPVAIANHILSLKHVVAMSQKILAQMIHTSHQTWQMLI